MALNDLAARKVKPTDNRVVFNIKGNDYRLVVAVKYGMGLMYIRFIGTHRQYDKIDVETI